MGVTYGKERTQDGQVAQDILPGFKIVNFSLLEKTSQSLAEVGVGHQERENTYTEESTKDGDVTEYTPILTLGSLLAVAASQTAQQLGDTAIRAAEEISISIPRVDRMLIGNNLAYNLSES